MRKLGILSVFLFILCSVVLAVPAFNIPDINMNEDTTTTINLDSYATGVTWTWTGNTHIIITKNSLNVATLTPQTNWNGVEIITFKATSTTDPTDFYQDTVSATVNPVNDVPTYSPTIPTQIWNEGNDYTLNLATYFHDADGDTLIYTWTPATLDDIDVSVVGNIMTFHPRDSKFVGENDIIITVSDGISSVSSGTITLRVEPNICRVGKIGQLTATIDSPDDGDDFKPGDTMDISVKVDNDYTKDLDIFVTAYLYDITKGERIDDIDSDVITIDSGDSDTFDLTMDVPSDVTDGDDFRLYARAIEDGHEDRQCDNDYISINIKKEKHDMIIPTFTLSPSTASCGDEISATLKTENIGRTNEKDVYFRLENSDLKLNLQTVTFDIDKNDAVKRDITFTIPEDAKEKTYTILAEVFFNDAADSNSKSATLTVSGCKAVIPGQEITLTPIEPSFDINAGDTKQVLVQITNNENEQVIYTIGLSASGFGQSADVPVTLDAEQTKVVPITLIVNADATTGTKTAIINVKSGNSIIKTSTVSVNVKGKQVTPTGGVIGIPNLFGSNILWILGDIVLVIVAIFFIRLIFTSGRSKMKEMK